MTGLELPNNLTKGLIDADIIGDKTYNIIVYERFVEGQKVFFDPIKKIQLPKTKGIT